MPEIASLSVGLYGNPSPLAATLASLDVMFQGIVKSAQGAGAAIDAAFAGETGRQTKLQAAFAKTTGTVSDLGLAAQISGGNMQAAFSSQATQMQAIGASASAAALQIEAMRGAAGAGVPSSGFGVPGAPVVTTSGGGGSSVSAAGANEANAAFTALGSTLRSVGTMLSLYVTAPIALLGGIAFKQAADFEQAMARIQGTFNLPKTAISELSALAVKLGADISLPNTSAVDAAQALQQLMASGLSMKDAMAAARTVLQLSAVAMIDNKTAAMITAQALNAYGLAGTQASMVTDLLVNGMRATGTSAESFSKGLTTVAPAAQLANQGIQDMATGVAMLVRAGMTAGSAGTALSTMLMRLANPTAAAKSLMSEFNIQVRNLDGTMKPLPAIFEEFKNKLGPAATVTKAFGGDIDEMDKKLKAAEATFKTAQKTMADLPPVIAQQNARLSDLRRSLADVDEPARKLTSTIADEKQKLALLTEEMNRHNTEGLAKMARANVDAKGRIAETSLEIGVQRNNLAKLRQELAQMQEADIEAGGTGRSPAIMEKQLEIVRLSNSIRTNREDIVDWKKQIADNDQQMRTGLEATKEKKLRIDELSGSLKENEKKLDDWNSAGKAAKTADLNASIGELNHQLADNKAKLVDAAKAQDALNVARQNAQRVTVAMTQADRDKIVGDIFGQRGFKPIEIAMKFNPSGYEALKKQITEVGTTNRVAVAIQDTMNGKINGLQTAARNLALTFGNQFNPQIRQAVDWMTRLTEKLNQMTPAQVSMVTRLAAMAAALGPVLLGLGMVTKLLGFLTSPLGLVVLAIGALALAWVTNFGDIQGKTRAFVEWIKPYLKQAWDFVKGDFQNAWDKIKSFFQEIWPKVQVLMERFQAFWDKHHQEIIGILKAAWDVIKGIVQTAWAIISGVINVGLDILNGDWTKAWEDTKATFKGVWDGMVNIVGGAFVALGLAIGVGLAGVGDILWKIFKSWIDMWADWGFKLALAATNAATQMGLGFTNGITDMVTQAVAAVVGLATNVINALRGVLGIHSPSAVMYDIGVNIGQGLANGIASTQSMVQSAWTKIATLPTKMGAVTGGGSGQDANGNVPGQAKAINSGSSTGSGHFLGSSYSEGWQWTNPISGVLDPAFQAITGAMTNAQAKQQSANFAWAADVVAAAKDLQAKFNVQAGLSPLAGDNSPLELGELEALRKQAASGQYSSITVGDKTLTRPGSTPAAGAGQAQGAAPTVAQTVNVYGGINNAGDLQTLTTQIVDKAARALRFGT